ncbi:flagellar protein export ATPase FliI [Aureibacillus halotolerans]|uniref:Type III secretion system FliI/YscN family ATPase n=1 Tax=Aureibacillus halotolerans TaxID=1508390 RepID=A0A4R6U046_9BACI|nr:flagellar protein export ATPase FliI [Aureibacillus halotolerans]TDQ39648.1 type III secretion system FliI/YscN family ATPase [Aureibacillus halotolerans]
MKPSTLKLLKHIEQADLYQRYGKVSRVVGLMIESIGPASSIGDVCYIHVGKGGREPVAAEVVGFKGEHLLLMPFSSTNDVAAGSLVEASNTALQVPAGDALIGKTVDALGRPLDGSSLPEGMIHVSADAAPLNPLERPAISEPMALGVKVLDGLLMMGKGQRMGIFAGSGVGKSTLLGMIARNSEADVNVIALIGERGREVREFIERDLGPEGLKRSVVVVATSDQPALMRIKGAFTATAIAEHFREQGLNVMFMMDSVTRAAMAQREVGLATGEPPTTKGYTPSVFGMLPRLLERAGNSTNGTMSAIYTVLVDGDDLNDPIADAVRGILDGHLVLDRAIANRGQFPAVHVLKSISRLMNHLASKEHLEVAEQIRIWLSSYEEAEDLIKIGAYKKGSSREVDQAVAKMPDIRAFLKQKTDESFELDDTLQALKHLLEGTHAS